MIKVLIIEDSPVAQELLTYVLTSDPALQIVGIVTDGADALQAVRETRPHVITMDIHMPRLDGFDATQAIMENVPTPIVIVSARSDAKSTESTFRAMNAGALAVVHRPPGIGHPNHRAAAQELIWTVKTMSEIKMVRRYPQPRINPAGSSILPRPSAGNRRVEVAAIGASTGGPLVLHTILSLLPADLAFPLLIVQHIAIGFVEGFVEWLNSTSHFPVHVAVDGEKPLPGHGYVAPDGFHLGISRGPRMVLSQSAPDNGLRPSVAYLFRTVAQLMAPQSVGILLSGMGQDGALELKNLKEMGGITIAQDEASSIVYGMPGEAIKLGAATYVLSPESIAAMLIDLARETKRK